MGFGAWQQGTSKDAGSVTSSTLAYGSNVTAGNTLIINLRQGGTGGNAITVSDNLNGNWTKDDDQQVTSAGNHTSWRFSNTAGGACTVTITFNSAATMRWVQDEYTGKFGLDGVLWAQGNSTSPSSGALTTKFNDAILGHFIGGGNTGTNNDVFTQGSNFTLREHIDLTSGTRTVVATEDWTAGVQPPGSYTADGTMQLADNWGMRILAYYDAGGAIAPASPLMLPWIFTDPWWPDTPPAVAVAGYLGPLLQQPYWTSYEREAWTQAEKLDISFVQSVDSPPIPPLPTVEWLRRRPDVEADQQPRRLLDLSITQSVDSPPIPPLPVVEWLRRRPDYEPDQQPRKLLDVGFVQSVDSPPLTMPPVVEWLRRRPDYETDQQPLRLVDTSVTMSVDSPPFFLAGQWVPTAKRVAGEQAVPLPIDIVFPPLTYLGPFVVQPYWTTPYEREQWLQARKLDVSTTQSVDSPPFFLVGQWEPVAKRFQTQQPPLLALDIVTLQPYLGTLGQQAQWRVYDYRQWRQARWLDVGVTQSVDSPPLHGPYPMAPYWVPPRRPNFYPVLFNRAFTLPAPDLGSILTTTAIIDGKVVTVGIVNGFVVTAPGADGQVRIVGIVDGRTITTAINDGRTRDT